MSSIRVVVKHGEAVVRPDQPELFVREEKISPGEEKSFDVYVGDGLEIKASLTEEMEAQAEALEEADKRVEEENQWLREEKEKKAEEKKAKQEWREENEKAKKEGREPDQSLKEKAEQFKREREEKEWEHEQELAKRQGRPPDQSKEPKPEDQKRAAQQGRSGDMPGQKPQGFVSSPAPKVDAPSGSEQSRSGIDSKEVKDQAPLKK